VNTTLPVTPRAVITLFCGVDSPDLPWLGGGQHKGRAHGPIEDLISGSTAAPQTPSPFQVSISTGVPVHRSLLRDLEEQWSK
jgi:hypothetical protein